jgi:hypothetical protein
MQVISLRNPVKVHILFLPHVINVDPLMFDYQRRFWIEHSPVPILMRECLESLITASLLSQAVARLVADGG